MQRDPKTITFVTVTIRICVDCLRVMLPLFCPLNTKSAIIHFETNFRPYYQHLHQPSPWGSFEDQGVPRASRFLSAISQTAESQTAKSQPTG
jgi:hypothetical protein